MKKFFVLFLILGLFGIIPISATQSEDGNALAVMFYAHYNYQYEMDSNSEDRFILISPTIGVMTRDGWVIIRSEEELSLEELQQLADTDFSEEILDSPNVLWYIE